MSHEVADPGDDVACFQLSAADAVWWASVFKTLGDPVRLQLLVHLAALGERKSPRTTSATSEWRSPP